MKQAIILTTDLIKTLSPDLFVKNESILLDRDRAAKHGEPVPYLGALTLSAMKSESSQTLESLAILCGTEAVALVKNAFGDEYRLWLFVSDGPWRQKNRIITRQKLWKLHPCIVGSDSIIKVGVEAGIEQGDLIRYSGLLEISNRSCSTAINAVRTNSALALIFSRRPGVDSLESVGEIFSSAFPRKKDGLRQESVDWLTIALHLCPKGDILLRISGTFDDRDVAADIIALKEVILKL